VRKNLNLILRSRPKVGVSKDEVVDSFTRSKTGSPPREAAGYLGAAVTCGS
jgi:hypothetical protein